MGLTFQSTKLTLLEIKAIYLYGRSFPRQAAITTSNPSVKLTTDGYWYQIITFYPIPWHVLVVYSTENRRIVAASPTVIPDGFPNPKLDADLNTALKLLDGRRNPAFG